MKYTAGDLTALRFGVAARLHIAPADLKVDYAPSIYLNAPKGYRDESATVRTYWMSKETYCFASANQLDKLDVGQVADEFVRRFNDFVTTSK